MITIVVVLGHLVLFIGNQIYDCELLRFMDFYFYITQKWFSYTFYFLVSMLQELLLLKAGLYDS